MYSYPNYHRCVRETPSNLNSTKTSSILHHLYFEQALFQRFNCCTAVNVSIPSLLESPQRPWMELTTPNTRSSTQVSARCPVRFIRHGAETRPQLSTRIHRATSQSKGKSSIYATFTCMGRLGRDAFYYRAASTRGDAALSL